MHGNVLRYEEVIKLACTDGKVILIILGFVNGITLGIDVGTKLDCLDKYFDGSNDCMLEELHLKTHCDLLMVKCFNLMYALNRYQLMVNCLALYLEM